MSQSQSRILCPHVVLMCDDLITKGAVRLILLQLVETFWSADLQFVKVR